MIQLTSTTLIVGAGALFMLAWVWRAGARRARATAEAARTSMRLVSLAGRVLVTTGLLVGVQWVVITHPGNLWVTIAVLALPDLLAAHLLTRTLTVMAVDTHAVGGRAAHVRRSRRGGGR
jgi:hypothetical protein